MIRHTLVGCAAGALGLFLVLTTATPQAQGQRQGQQGGLTALQAQIQALEAAVKQLQEEVAAEIAARTAADAAESAARAAADTTLQGNIDAEAAARTAADVTLQARITTLGDQVTALQQLFESLNPAVNTAQQNIADLRTDLDALEGTVDKLGGGLTSYDQLHGLPCTTAVGGKGTVNFVGLLKSPVCAAGISANGRFFDLGLVVLDTQTNLMWEKKDNAGSLHHVGNGYTWCQATGDTAGICGENATSWIGQVNAEVFAGFNNWRVPTRDELLTIVDMNTGPPRIDPIFGPTQAADYWSSTDFHDDNFARVVSFFWGVASVANKSFEFDVHVRAVRAGS